MNPSQEAHQRTLKAKKTATNPPSLANPGHSGPTTFFLRSEKEVEKNMQRGRKTSRDSDTTVDGAAQKTPMGSIMRDSSFGVQSLEDTIGMDNSLSRTESNTSEASMEAGAEGVVRAGSKRKAGNPVHPKILATGQRIISSEHSRYATGSPVSLRSVDSSVNLSQPLTPLRLSPRPQSAVPSTPRSGSPKSFRLSDEEISVASDTGSQAVQSSSGEEDDEDAGSKIGNPDAMPQLVMPSIAMPTRRPFTEKGKRMGRIKVMVVGARGVGKTSLIQSICRACEDIVHVDPLTGSRVSQPDRDANDLTNVHTKYLVEVGASTRPYPQWWTDFESRRQLLRRKSVGEGVLERNITFVDTPGFDSGRNVQHILNHFKSSLSRMSNMQKMNDIELINMLSGDGGGQIDAVIYVFDSAASSTESPQHLQMDQPQALLLQYLCKWTNVIPIIGRSDAVDAEELKRRKGQLLEMFESLKAQPCISTCPNVIETEGQANAEEPREPYAISSALGDDTETIDASVLMSSGYLQPLVPSELELFVSQLLEPDNIARLRHLSATKFLLWRQEHLFTHLDLQKQTRLNPQPWSPDLTSADSVSEDASKSLVPRRPLGLFRSTSTSASDSSALSGGNGVGASASALALYNEQNTTEPFRQVRLAKWAQDLQRSIEKEGRRYLPKFTTDSSSASDSEKQITASDPTTSLITTTNTSRPAKGRLGGDLGVIDPRDPLGILAFSQSFRRHGYFALQVAGGCGIIGAVAWWVMKNWIDLQEFFGLGQSQTPIHLTGVPAPTRGLMDDLSWREVVGLGRG